MNTTKIPVSQRPDGEAYLSPRWSIAALVLGGWDDWRGRDWWDPACGGDAGWTVGGMLHETRTPGDAGRLALTDRRLTPVGEVLDFEAGPVEQIDGLVVGTNPPHSRLDFWLDRCRATVGPSGFVAFLVARLSLSAAELLPSGVSRRDGLVRIVSLVDARVKFELTPREAAWRAWVNREVFGHPIPADLLPALFGDRRPLPEPKPKKPLAFQRDGESGTGWVVGSPATDHCWAIWGGYGCPPPPADVPTRFVSKRECDAYLAARTLRQAG